MNGRRPFQSDAPRWRVAADGVTVGEVTAHSRTAALTKARRRFATVEALHVERVNP